MQGFLQEDCRSFYDEGEMGVSVELQGASRDEIDMVGEPTPLNYLLPVSFELLIGFYIKCRKSNTVWGLNARVLRSNSWLCLRPSKLGEIRLRNRDFFFKKKKRELKRLTWSINYEGSSSKERLKGKGPAFSL